MNAPSDGHRDRGDAPDRRRRWASLGTPEGFERCVRETLREVYGYAALLVGRDRNETETRVADVYRSLFRAARAGHIDDVSLGALRSAVRRTWLEDHFVEIVSVFEIAGTQVATIAELSTLERATIVLRYVNEMSVEAVALELGRSERDVAAVDAHAVRRLRGTDDTSGAWVRAYLGPAVTPTPGLIDRIVDRLHDPEPVPEARPGPAATTEPVAEPEPVPDVGSIDEPVPVPGAVAEPEPVPDVGSIDEPVPVPGAVAEPVPDPVSGPVSDLVSDPVPELMSVPEPVFDVGPLPDPRRGGSPADVPMFDPIEVRRVPPADLEPLGAFEPIPGAFEPIPGAFEPGAVDVDGSRPSSGPDDPTGPRPRWVVAVGAALVLGLVSFVVAVLVRGSTDATIAVTVTTVQQVTTTTVSVTSVPESVPLTEAAVVVGADAGFAPRCTETVGGTSGRLEFPDVFGVLRERPTLVVGLPRSVDASTGASTLPVSTSTWLAPDGLAIAVRTDERSVPGTALASIGFDGDVRWIRCLTDRYEIAAVPESGIDLAIRSTAAGAEWTLVSLDDGSVGGRADPVQSALLDAAISRTNDGATDGTATGAVDGVALGFSYDGGLGRSVLAGLDDGAVVWTVPDVVVPDDGGFGYEVVGDVVMVRTCPDEPADEPADEPVDESAGASAGPDGGFADCPGGQLRGYDLASGELSWSRDGDHAVPVVADGIALVGTADGWDLVDVATGVTVGDRRWDDPTTFPLRGDLGDVLLVGGSLVVVTPDAVTVWLPDGFGGLGVEFDLLEPDVGD